MAAGDRPQAADQKCLQHESPAGHHLLALRQQQAFQASLAALNHREDSPICVLTPGPLNETYFEHAYLARYLGFLLVEGEDLTVQHDGVFIRTVLGWYRRRGRRAGVPDGQSGTVTVVQRFGSGLELNVHFHALGLDGVFAPGADGTLRFHRLPPPTDADVARLAR